MGLELTDQQVISAFAARMEHCRRPRATQWPIGIPHDTLLRGLKHMLQRPLAEGTEVTLKAVLEAQASKPWLLLHGGVGRGKTAMMRVVWHAIHSQPSRPSSPKWLQARQMLNAETYAQAMSAGLLVIDDLGTEPATKNDYGTLISPTEGLIEHRYEMGLATYITTNLPAQALLEAYGSRVVDRIREMAAVVNFDGFHGQTLR